MHSILVSFRAKPFANETGALDRSRRTIRPYFIGLFWSGRRDLNPRPPVPQTGALTGLRHAPTGTARTIGMRLSRCNNAFSTAFYPRRRHLGAPATDVLGAVNAMQ